MSSAERAGRCGKSKCGQAATHAAFWSPLPDGSRKEKVGLLCDEHAHEIGAAIDAGHLTGMSIARLKSVRLG